MKIETNNGTVEVTMSGRLDTMNSESILSEIIDKIDEKNKNIILDLKELDYISSSGLRVLIKLRNKVTELKGGICLLSPQEFVVDVLKTTSFDKLFPMFSSKEECSEYLK